MIVNLDLSYSRLTVSGLQRLKDAVLCKQLTQLEKLTLHLCPISDAEVIISFITAVKANCLNLYILNFLSGTLKILVGHL